MKIPKATKLPSGNWRIGMMEDGQRISITAPTKQEAERRAAAIKGGASVEKRAASITLTAAIDSYIDLKSAVLSPATLRGYRGIQNHRFPSLMTRDVRSLTKQDVQLAVNAEARRVSAKTVCNAYGLIRPVLKECGVDVFGVRLPQAVKPIKRYPSRGHRQARRCRARRYLRDSDPARRLAGHAPLGDPRPLLGLRRYRAQPDSHPPRRRPG